MAFEQDTASGVADLVSRLITFLTSNGWTDRALTTTAAEGLAKTTASDQIEVQFRWDNASPQHLGVFHSLDFDAVGTAPGNHTDDSGQGVISGTNATIATGRHVTLVNSAMPYWFFEDDHYCHVVCQTATSPAAAVHFGMGNLNKRGTWTGGAYCYGFKRSATTSNPIGLDLSILLDGIAAQTTMTAFVASLHAEGLPNQDANGKWMLVWGDSVAARQGTDRAGEDRLFCQGGFRGGLVPRFFGRPSAQAVAGLIPMYPITLFYRDLVPSPDRVYRMGDMPDVFGINIQHFTLGQEILVGGDTYVVFPSWRNDTGGSNDTRRQGIAYRKVTT